jgi:hypothetical protein
MIEVKIKKARGVKETAISNGLNIMSHFSKIMERGFYGLSGLFLIIFELDFSHASMTDKTLIICKSFRLVEI